MTAQPLHPDASVLALPGRFTVPDMEYLTEVQRFAASVGKLESLQRCLDRLQRIAENLDGTVHMGRDFAPYSFLFGIEAGGRTRLNGGVIFHGSHDNGGDGSAPTYSVSLDPQDGWSIHT